MRIHVLVVVPVSGYKTLPLLALSIYYYDFVACRFRYETLFFIIFLFVIVIIMIDVTRLFSFKMRSKLDKLVTYNEIGLA